MKNLTTVFVIAGLLLYYPLFGQRYKLELSAEGGPSFGLVYGAGAKQLEKQLPMIGFETGIGVRVHMPKVIGIYTGLFTERKGFVLGLNVVDAVGNAVTYKYNCEYHYVKIPLMINATLGKKVLFFVNAGGYVSALFRIHIYLKELGVDNVNPGGYQYVDAGICTGAGIKVPYKRWMFGLEGRNSTGFLKIIKNTEPRDAIFNTNTSVLLSVAYSFAQWKK